MMVGHPLRSSKLIVILGAWGKVTASEFQHPSLFFPAPHQYPNEILKKRKLSIILKKTGLANQQFRGWEQPHNIRVNHRILDQTIVTVIEPLVSLVQSILTHVSKGEKTLISRIRPTFIIPFKLIN